MKKLRKDSSLFLFLFSVFCMGMVIQETLLQGYTELTLTVFVGSLFISLLSFFFCFLHISLLYFFCFALGIVGCILLVGYPDYVSYSGFICYGVGLILSVFFFIKDIKRKQIQKK